MSTYKSILEKFEGNLWGFHIKVESSIAEKYIEKNDRRVLCSIDGANSFPCALMPHNSGKYFINLNKTIRTKHRLNIGDTVAFSLEKDDSEYGLPMPEEMKELLAIDDEADKYFHALTPGKQRSLLYIIGKPKRSESRLNKALAITEYLKEYKGAIDFKVMNTFIKEYNKF